MAVALWVLFAAGVAVVVLAVRRLPGADRGKPRGRAISGVLFGVFLCSLPLHLLSSTVANLVSFVSALLLVAAVLMFVRDA